jgi:hypothetical protein
MHKINKIKVWQDRKIQNGSSHTVSEIHLFLLILLKCENKVELLLG